MSEASKSKSSKQEVQSESESDYSKIEVPRGHSAVTMRLKEQPQRALPRKNRPKDKSTDNQIASEGESNLETDYLARALDETIEENFRLKKRVGELEALLAAAHDEIEDRDNAINELSKMVAHLSKTKREERLILENIEMAFQKSE